MASDTGGTRSAHPRTPATGGRGERAPLERCGPLAVARHVKGDGRSLLLYTRVEVPADRSERGRA